MGYNKRLTPKALETIQPLIRELEALDPGTSFKFHVNHQEMGDKVRNWLYTWLKINNLKPLYKIKQIGLLEFVLIRLPVVSVKISEELPLNPVEEYVRDNLLDFKTEEEVMLKLKNALDLKEIDHELYIKCFEEWERVQGRGDKIGPEEAPNPFLDSSLKNPNQ